MLTPCTSWTRVHRARCSARSMAFGCCRARVRRGEPRGRIPRRASACLGRPARRGISFRPASPQSKWPRRPQGGAQTSGANPCPDALRSDASEKTFLAQKIRARRYPVTLIVQTSITRSSAAASASICASRLSVSGDGTEIPSAQSFRRIDFADLDCQTDFAGAAARAVVSLFNCRCRAHLFAHEHDLQHHFEPSIGMAGHCC